MGFSLSDLGLPFSLWVLGCAVLLPLLCAVGVFACLRRAPLGRKMTCFFLMTPLYVVVTVFLFSSVPGFLSGMAPEVWAPVSSGPVGLMAALTVGILYLGLSVLICGAGLMKRRGIVASMICTLLCFGLSAAASGAAWYRGYEDQFAELPWGAITVGRALPFTGLFLPGAAAGAGVELICAALFLLYLLAYFLCFLSVRAPGRIADDAARRRRAALTRAIADGDVPDGTVCLPEIERCCAHCEYAQTLRSTGFEVVCDRCGVVSASHVCRHFINDPLKRIPARPVLRTPEEALPGDEAADSPASGPAPGEEKAE